eukprot:TRINITY_DN1308_c0_g1_i2.p1 TRINITY_DN1308_c0_g1~~TRINITY_DN1308_c0_g1_i2.p1  ORF type:complete len:119 (+),score=28.90 TRINITY_DN1308_c0_g1_i2:166-522(+)
MDATSPRKENEKIAQVRSFMGKRIKVVISDGRIITGKFYCFDQQGNILVSEAEEEKPKKEVTGVLGANRLLGIALIPFKFVLECFIDQNDEKRADRSTTNIESNTTIPIASSSTETTV